MKPYFDDGQITLYHGDCREILPALGEQSADLVLTDPPYNVDFSYDGAYHDRIGDYAGWVGQWFPDGRRVGRVVMVTTGMGNLWDYPRADWVMCWAKPGAMRQSGLGGFNQWEPILVYGKERRLYQDFIWLPARTATSLDRRKGHPCPKPLPLYVHLVRYSSDPGGLVVDPFAGSGTALLAARLLGRRAIGVEISERYCELIVASLAKAPLALEPEPRAVELPLDVA